MPRPRVPFARRLWQAPDGDTIAVDFVEAAMPAGGPAAPGAGASARDAPGRDGPAGAAPLLVLFLGLEGSSRSHYAAALMDAARRRGWRGAVAHFRGCGGAPNRLPRAYHSGDSDEIDWVLQRMRDEHAQGAPLFVAGVSLGANALLKWLGERGAAARFVQAAAGVSAPQDLHAGAMALSHGFNRVYTRNFLVTLKRKSAAMLARHPGLFDADRLRTARTFFDFDDLVTAPLHGFADAMDYWRRSSCKPYLGGIEVPTLVINARNDPFLPAAALAGPHEVSAAVTLCYPATGGHVGFVEGAPPGRLDWLARTVLGFMQRNAHG